MSAYAIELLGILIALALLIFLAFRGCTLLLDERRKLVPNHGSYVSESNYFEADWQGAFWSANYSRLRQVKDKYDPAGLFFVRHGVGSEDWSTDSFTRLR
jgi:hypothetical protein